MKSLRLSIVAMSVGAIVGCGGEDSSGSDTKTKATVYQAEVADEHLQDALVWLDINNNYQLDAGEPNSYTDSTGKALLEVTAIYTVPQAHSLIASAIKDRTINKTTGEKVSKSYMMVAPAGVQRISPVSHLIYSKQKAEGYDFAQATTTVADIIDEVSEQDLVQFLNKQDNKKLQALSYSLSSMMPESETPLTHLQLVQSHPDLETAVAAFNDRSIKKLKAEFGHVSDENPIPVVVGQTVTTDVRRASDNKQSVETGLSVPNNQGSTPTTTTEASHPNQTEESVPVKVIIPTLEVTTRTDTQGTAQVPESNPQAPEQLLSPDQGAGEGTPSDGVPETGITGNNQPNETAPALDAVTTGTNTQGTAQVPESNPQAPEQLLSPDQGAGEGTSSDGVPETGITGNSQPNETAPALDAVTTGTDTQGTAQVPESNPLAPEQVLSPDQGAGEGTPSDGVPETGITGNNQPNETAPALDAVTTGTNTQGTAQVPESNPQAPEQLLSPDQGAGEGTPSDGVPETGITGNNQPNETAPALDAVTTGTNTQGTAQVPESNPQAPEQLLSPDQGAGEGTSSDGVPETGITGNSQPNETAPALDAVTTGTDTQGTAQVPESNPLAPEQVLSPDQGAGEGTPSYGVPETGITGNNQPNETAPALDAVTTGTNTQGTAQVPESNPQAPEQLLSPDQGAGEGTPSDGVPETGFTGNNQPNETAPALDAGTTGTDTLGTAQVPESNPLAPEQLLSPDQGAGEGTPSDGVPETGITGNNQPNETASALDAVTTGTNTQGTAQVPESNPQAPEQLLSPDQGAGEGTPSDGVPETGITGNSQPNETAPALDAVTTGTDTQGTAQVPESNPQAPEQLLSPDQGAGEGTPSDGVPETEITGNSQPNETALALEPEKSGTVIEATTQNLPFNNAEAQPVQTPIVADIGTLLTRISDELVTAEEDSAFDQSKSLDVLASELIYGLQADGRWLDIEYDGTTSYRLSAEHHLERLQTIAAAFRKTNNQEYELLANKALNFWLITKPIMAGWWSEYGEFHALAQVAFLLGDGLREDLRLEVIQLLPTSVNTSEVGLPVLDHAMNIIYRGLLLNDALLVGNGLKAIERAIEALVVEGTEADWSTVLNKQFDSGKSTIEYFNVALSWAYSVKDLTWKFSDIAINNLTSMLLNGIRWFDRVNQLNESFSYNDESISKSTIPTLATLNKVVDLNPTRLKEVQDYRSHLYYDRPSGESRFLHFWEDDYTETATDGYLFRVGMKSDRTVSILSHEEQYQPGFWARLGSAFLTLSGDEYRDILPLFDWTKVPGVTAPKYVPTGYSLSDALQNSSFVGGTGNGRFGISTMVMEVVIPREFVAMEEFYQPNGQVIVGGKYVGGTTKAKKSWFSFGKQVVALGAGISSTHDDVPVTTTLNQTLLDGEVTLGNQYGYAYLNHSGEPYHNINLSNWIHHDGVGYVFLDQLPRMVLMNQQSGRWSDIQPLASQNIIEKGVFTLFTYHGVKPTNSYYQYVILPNSTVHEVHEYRRNLPVLILQNSSSIQAVADVEKDIVGAVFFEPGELDVGLYHPNYSNYRVKVDRPSVVILDNSSGLMEVAISTPGQAYSVVDLTVVRDGYSPITQQVVTPGKKELVGRSVNFVLSEGQDHNSITDSLAIEALNNKNYSQ